MKKLLFILVLIISLYFASWSVNDCKQKCSELDMAFTAWASDSPAETCNNVVQEGPDNNGFATFSCKGSDGTDVFVCGCKTQCADGEDNDNGGKADLADPGCENKKDNDETSQCQDGIDNDGDGKIDGADSACSDPENDSEIGVCQDGIDNDGGGKTDIDDPGCSSPEDESEISECQDGVDNDGDTGIDMADPGCSDPEDNREIQGICKYSVLITGGIDDFNNDVFFWKETLQKYKMITGEWGTSANNTYLLYFNGSINKSTGDARIDGAATLAEIEKVFDEIAKKAKECTDRCDNVEITIFLGNHGAPDGTNLFGNEILTPAKLRSLLEKIKNTANGNKISLWLDASNCYSGVFLSLGDLVNGVATAVNYNETAGYNSKKNLSFQLSFTDALLNGSSWKDAWEKAKNKTIDWGWNVGNDSEHPQYDGTGAVCGDGKVAKSSLYGSQKEECDLGDPSKGIAAIGCPGEQVCINCSCYYPYYYLNCANDLCVMNWDTIPINNHPLCSEEGEYCGNDVVVHTYLDCINEVCVMAESEGPAENHPLCEGSAEGDSCSSEPIMHYYYACVDNYCVLAQADNPTDNYPSCSAAGQYCGEDIVIDTDEDGITDYNDNCPEIENSAQSDVDEDGIGDLCDPCPYDTWNDFDEDELCADEDNCEWDYNPEQENADSDQYGDICDPCPNDALNDVDQDNYCAEEDNCPNTYNPTQSDMDGDGIGDHCDANPVDCNVYCAGEGYAVSLGTGGIGELACTALGEQIEGINCKTACIYLYYKPWSWPANSYSCCCRSVFYYSCINCPAEVGEPVCPSCSEDKPQGTGV